MSLKANEAAAAAAAAAAVAEWLRLRGATMAVDGALSGSACTLGEVLGVLVSPQTRNGSPCLRASQKPK